MEREKAWIRTAEFTQFVVGTLRQLFLNLLQAAVAGVIAEFTIVEFFYSIQAPHRT